MDLNAIKAKAGISDKPDAEKTSLSTGESHRSGGSVGKRRFWYPEQDNSTTAPIPTPPETSVNQKGEQKASKGLAKGEPEGEQRASKGLAKGERESDASQPKGEQRASKGLAKGEPKGEQENPRRVSKGLAKGEQGKAAFGKLVGLQRKILLLVYESMQVTGNDLTEPMSSTQLAEGLSADRLTVKDALRRLRVKGALFHGEVKNGNGGWVRYAIPSTVRAEVFAWQRVSKGLAKGEPKGEQTGPSSSSYIENKFTPTTTAETRARADNEWTPEDLDYSMLTDVGFGRSQALQLRSLGISFDVVQRSLVYFEFELRYTASGKTIQEPLALLMKRMRQNGCWEAPEEYEKRHAHFRSCFAEREQQLQKDTPIEETSGDLLAAGDSIISPAGVDHGEQLR